MLRLDSNKIRDLGIDLTVKAGEGDFDRVREILVQQQTEGATIAFKLSGRSSRHPKAIVHPTAEVFLQPEALFILLATKMQLELLTELGTMASTDGTHAIFQYNNIKVIVVLVTSFAVERNMKERGFPMNHFVAHTRRIPTLLHTYYARIHINIHRHTIHTC